MRIAPFALLLVACTSPNEMTGEPDMAEVASDHDLAANASDLAAAADLATHDRDLATGADLAHDNDLATTHDLATTADLATTRDMAEPPRDMTVPPRDMSSKPNDLGGADLAILPGSKCTIGGTQYAGGTLRPGNACQYCQPALSTSDWSSLDDGTACPSGLCVAGACGDGCLIDHVYYSPDAVSTANPCQSCQPSRSRTSFSPVVNGTSCGGANQCNQGQCRAFCTVGGGVYLAGAANPANVCESCQPGVSLTAFSPNDGADCGSAMVCFQRMCMSGCVIASVPFHPGDSAQLPLGGDSCQTCQPAKSTHDFSPATDGTTCSTLPFPFPGGSPNGVCKMGSCTGACFVGNVSYPVGAGHPTDKCQICTDPGLPLGAIWDARPDGTSCGVGKTCMNGKCP